MPDYNSPCIWQIDHARHVIEIRATTPESKRPHHIFSQHRMLLTDILFGTRDILVVAVHLINPPGRYWRLPSP
ncbi:MAG: hypothetical protein GDA53_00995 [Rhodobacteraceae bacterium]|nr:hypothetical protein [Paracoccaceae bacterium]